MLEHLQNRGYQVVLLLGPLAGEELSEAQFKLLGSHFPHSVLWNRSGEVLYAMAQGGSVLEKLQGTLPDAIGSRLGEGLPKEPRGGELLSMERSFCPDGLAHLALRLQAGLGRCAVMAQYVFMTRFLPLVGSGALKIVDTHDVFSSKEKSVVRFGVKDTLGLRSEEEREWLLRADLVLAIQPEEGGQLAALVPERRVVRTGVDFGVAEFCRPQGHKTLLYVASANAMNVKGLIDFLRFAWPRIANAVPEARFVVAGKVGQSAVCGDTRVQLLGPVEDLERLYEDASVVINPSVAGTGLKIKTVEAICHFRPVVTWPTGVAGMEREMQEVCFLAEDWYQFGDRVIEVLSKDTESIFSAERRESIRQLLAPDNIYAGLVSELELFFGHRAPEPARSRSKFDAGN
jgi:glycosyltransferase involved in cell wall biosynthesis